MLERRERGARCDASRRECWILEWRQWAELARRQPWHLRRVEGNIRRNRSDHRRRYRRNNRFLREKLCEWSGQCAPRRDSGGLQEVATADDWLAVGWSFHVATILVSGSVRQMIHGG